MPLKKTVFESINTGTFHSWGNRSTKGLHTPKSRKRPSLVLCMHLQNGLQETRCFHSISICHEKSILANFATL